MVSTVLMHNTYCTDAGCIYIERGALYMELFTGVSSVSCSFCALLLSSALPMSSAVGLVMSHTENGVIIYTDAL